MMVIFTVYCKSIYKVCAGLPDPKRRSNCTFNLTTPNILLSSMAAANDVEHQQLFSISYVNGHLPVTFLIVTYYSSPGPSASQNAGRGCVNPLFCVPILSQNRPWIDLESPNRRKAHPSYVSR